MSLLDSRSVGGSSADWDPKGGNDMSELKTYDVVVNGWQTTVKLTEADAAARGLTDADTVEARTAAKQAPARANKSRTAANKGAD